MKKVYSPKETTVRKVKRVQEMVDNDWKTADACQEVGIRLTSFYFYRRRLGLKTDQLG